MHGTHRTLLSAAGVAMLNDEIHAAARADWSAVNNIAAAPQSRYMPYRRFRGVRSSVRLSSNVGGALSIDGKSCTALHCTAMRCWAASQVPRADSLDSSPSSRAVSPASRSSRPAGWEIYMSEPTRRYSSFTD